MNGMITVGAMSITIETAWKAGVIGFLATIAASLGYIVYWIST